LGWVGSTVGKTLVLKVRSHSEPNYGNRVGIPFQLSIFGPETT